MQNTEYDQYNRPHNLSNKDATTDESGIIKYLSYWQGSAKEGDKGEVIDQLQDNISCHRLTINP